MGHTAFRVLYEDTPGGKYIRCVGKLKYHMLEWTDMDDACGKGNKGEPRYCVELAEVDLLVAPRAQVEKALNSCGWTLKAFSPTTLMPCTITNDWDGSVVATGKRVAWRLAQTLHDYGAKAPLWRTATNNLKLGMREGRAESALLTEDRVAYAERMIKNVNALGSTTREFAQGDFTSAILRGVRAGNANARLMAKMHGASEENIAAVAAAPTTGSCFRASIDLGQMTRQGIADPIAFQNGFVHAMAGMGLDDDRKDLAEAYVLGYHLGVQVRTGDAPVPTWAK